MSDVVRPLEEWLRESVRSGLLFGRFDEPLDDYGKRIVRAILVEIESATLTNAGATKVEWSQAESAQRTSETAPQRQQEKDDLSRRDGDTASGPTGSSRSPQPADSSVDWESAAWFAGKARNLRVLRSRFRAGDSAEELAADYRLPIEWVGRVVQPGFDLLSGDDGPDWEPMETAPKDGRDVLVALPTGVDVANWQEEKPDGMDGSVVVDPGLPEGWYGYLGLCPWDKEQPSHWMPLPESPRLVPAGATPLEQGATESAHRTSGGDLSAPSHPQDVRKDEI